MIKGLMLFIIAAFFTMLFSVMFIPMSAVYYLITLKWKTGLKRGGKYFHQMGLSIDQYANVSLQSVFNIMMIKKSNRKRVIGTTSTLDPKFENSNKWEWQYHTKFDFHPFGDEDDTLSYVFAMNKKRNSLNRFGLIWANMLNKVDDNHLQKAIDEKLKRDIQAAYRLKEQGHNIVIPIGAFDAIIKNQKTA